MNNYTKEPNYLRNCYMHDTYEWDFYLDWKYNIVWIQSEDINWWELIWEETIKIVTMWVGNVVKGIIEDKNYKSINSLFREITSAYSNKILRAKKSWINKKAA